MSKKELTKETYHVLCILYKVYLQRRKDGISKSDAIRFDRYENIATEYIPQMHKDDVYSAIIELKNQNLVKLFIDGGFNLLDSSLVLMENRFKNSLYEVMDFVSKIPFI